MKSTPNTYSTGGTRDKSVNRVRHRMTEQNQKVPRYDGNTTTLGNAHSGHDATTNTYARSAMASIQQRLAEEKTIRNEGEQTKAKPKLNKEEKHQTTRNKDSRDCDSLGIDSAPKASERILQIEKPTNKSALN